MYKSEFFKNNKFSKKSEFGSLIFMPFLHILISYFETFLQTFFRDFFIKFFIALFKKI